MNFFLQDEHKELQRSLSSFVKTLAPIVVAEDHAVEQSFRAYVKRLSEDNLLAYAASRKTLSLRSVCLIREALAYTSTLADLAFVMQGLGTFAAIQSGSEALSAHVSERACSGDFICAFALTEPNAGSDVGNIPRRRRRRWL
jgi:acyl-CoA dehydrogenase